MTRLSSALLVFSTILLTACSESASPPCADTEPVRALTSTPILRLEYGTSFGYCIGYCKTWIEASEGGVMYTKTGWHDITPVSCSTTLPCQAWAEKWADLVSAIDLEAFENLDEVIGCPDCTDGGAEWLEIVTLKGRHKVTYEYTAPPEPIKAYRDALFELKESFNKCE